MKLLKLVPDHTNLDFMRWRNVALVISLVVLAVSPNIVAYELSEKRTTGATYRARSELARELTEAWHKRFFSAWPVVAAAATPSTASGWPR